MNSRLPKPVPLELETTTERLVLDLESMDAVVASARRVLADGGIVAFPTESFYGVGVCANHVAAIERLARVKARDGGKPIPVIAATRVDVDRIGPMPEALAPLAAEFWPGPLTLAIPMAAPTAWPAPLSAGTGTIGVRVSRHQLALRLAAAAGGLITASSANPAGGPPPTSPAGFDPDLVRCLGLIVDVGLCAGGLPSTVVGIRNGEVVILREGAIGRADIERVLRAAGEGRD